MSVPSRLLDSDLRQSLTGSELLYIDGWRIPTLGSSFQIVKAGAMDRTNLMRTIIMFGSDNQSPGIFVKLLERTTMATED